MQQYRHTSDHAEIRHTRSHKLKADGYRLNRCGQIVMKIEAIRKTVQTTCIVIAEFIVPCTESNSQVTTFGVSCDR